MCGVEPLQVVEVTTLGDPEPRYVPSRWPAGDHQHAVTPPTPAELLSAADAAVQRILAVWAS